MTEDVVDAAIDTLKAHLPDLLTKFRKRYGSDDRRRHGAPVPLPDPKKYVHGPEKRIPEGDYPLVVVIPEGFEGDSGWAQSRGAFHGDAVPMRIEVYVVGPDIERTTRAVERYGTAVAMVLGQHSRLGGAVKAGAVGRVTYESRADGSSVEQRAVIPFEARTVSSYLAELLD